MANLGNRDAMLREVLGHKVKRSSFVDFCNREHCAENLLFYNAICEFEGAGDEAARVAKVRSFRRQRRAANPVRCSPYPRIVWHRRVTSWQRTSIRGPPTR